MGRSEALVSESHRPELGRTDPGPAGRSAVPPRLSDKVTAMRDAGPGLVVLYRWRLHPGAEASFTAAWSGVPQLLRERGSLGARLHRGADGVWYSYAQWPGADVRAAAFAAGPLDAAAAEQMHAAIAERFPELLLEPVVDMLRAADELGAPTAGAGDGLSAAERGDEADVRVGGSGAVTSRST